MAKKQLIMEKAIELFAKQGFEATSVQQITDHCGISKGAFYLAFKSKDELISALVDEFIEGIIVNLDSVVKSSDDKENMLYHFYYGIFDLFSRNANLGMLFIKEQAHSFNEEFINKFRNYDLLFELTILNMIEVVYELPKKEIKYDLMFSIKGLMHAYTPLFFIDASAPDITRLAESLVEKTNLLAANITMPLFTEELYQLTTQQVKEEVVSEEKLVELLSKKQNEVTDLYVQDSILLLKEQLLEQSLSRVLIKGLIENIRNHPECRWLSYLLSKYYHF